MSRHKPPEDIRRRRETRNIPKGSSREKTHGSWWKGPWALISGLSIVVGLIVGVIFLLPRLSIESSGSLRSRDPMGTVFSISNDSPLSIYNVQILCDIDDVKLQDGGGMSGGGTIVPPDSYAETLSPGQKMNAPCDNALALRGSAKSAKITIRVGYNPFIGFGHEPFSVWWRRHAEFRMAAAQSEDGSWIWRNVGH
jgi:hypothetical protein